MNDDDPDFVTELAAVIATLNKALGVESTIVRERAQPPESTKIEERANLRESTNTAVRATNLRKYHW